MKMPIEYIVNVHKFIHDDNEKDVDKLAAYVKNHLRYIPYKCLYRYRRCEEREFTTLENDSIWMSAPETFSDVFDSTILMEHLDSLEKIFPMFALIDLIHQALIDSAEPNEKIPDQKTLFRELLQSIEEYKNVDVRTKCIQLMGEDFFDKWSFEINDSFNKINFRPHTKILKDFLTTFSNNSQKFIAAASFTTKFDNRNMWENYAANYTGFCVEYSFKKFVKHFTAQDAWNILHFLPIQYSKYRPSFSYENLIWDWAHRGIDRDWKLISDIDSFLQEYYKSMLYKSYDYRAEDEWRLILPRSNVGKYEFPYVSSILLGKDISQDHQVRLLEIAEKLKVPVYKQTYNKETCTFDYIEL